ncbi:MULTISPECIES: hypothetical protein [Metallibacterium]|jgi:hypothetical protein|uniref:hypothetical protein n=1 Tax=Metallibacterium TaxID=1218803 RepID=UPI00262F7437|nr:MULTISPECIES: hypothetical protein [Metallibacterium]MBW8075272.1 hypothetical protein [Metallibacterium scheffleri]
MDKRTRDDDNLDGIDDRDGLDNLDNLDHDADRVDNDNVADVADNGRDVHANPLTKQATPEVDETTIWLIANDPAMRARINKKRAQQHCQPLDESSIARAAKNRDNRNRKRDRAPIGADRPRGEADRELMARGNFGGWPTATAFGSNLLSLDDPEQAAAAAETLRDYVAERLAVIDGGRGGRPRGDVGKAQLKKILKALGMVLGGDAEKLQAVQALLDKIDKTTGTGGAA